MPSKYSARRRLGSAARKLAEARAERDKVIRATAGDLTRREAAKAVGLSPTRVTQIVLDEEPVASA